MRPLPSAFPKAEALFLRGKYHHYHVRMFERTLCEDRFRTPPALRTFPRNHRRSFTKIDYQGTTKNAGIYLARSHFFEKYGFAF